jgi:hypothetical protein
MPRAGFEPATTGDIPAKSLTPHSFFFRPVAFTASCRRSKRIVSEDELERYLARGLDVQTMLPSGRMLIRRVVA